MALSMVKMKSIMLSGEGVTRFLGRRRSWPAWLID